MEDEDDDDDDEVVVAAAAAVVVVVLIKVKKLSKLEYFLNDALTAFKKNILTTLTWMMRRKMV